MEYRQLVSEDIRSETRSGGRESKLGRLNKDLRSSLGASDLGRCSRACPEPKLKRVGAVEIHGGVELHTC